MALSRRTLGLPLALLALAAPLLAADAPVVWLTEVPAWSADQGGPYPEDESWEALQVLSDLLRDERLAFTHPAEEGASLEALNWVADVNRSALFVGIRSTGTAAQCVALHVPAAPEEPSTLNARSSREEIAEVLRRAVAAERASASAALAAQVAAAVPTCLAISDPIVEEFLSLTSGPTVLVELRPVEPSPATSESASDTASLLRSVAGAIGRFVAESEPGDWRHPVERFD